MIMGDHTKSACAISRNGTGSLVGHSTIPPFHYFTVPHSIESRHPAQLNTKTLKQNDVQDDAKITNLWIISFHTIL